MNTPELPKKIEFDLEPVVHGRVQVLCRITTEDKNDLMRVVNYTGLNQQEVMRMLLVRACRKYVAMMKAQEPIPEMPTSETIMDIGHSAADDITKEVFGGDAEVLRDPTKG